MWYVFIRAYLIPIKFDRIKHEIVIYINDFIGPVSLNLWLANIKFAFNIKDLLEEKLGAFACQLYLEFSDRPALVSPIPRVNHQELCGSIRDCLQIHHLKNKEYRRTIRDKGSRVSRTGRALFDVPITKHKSSTHPECLH